MSTAAVLLERRYALVMHTQAVGWGSVLVEGSAQMSSGETLNGLGMHRCLAPGDLDDLGDCNDDLDNLAGEKATWMRPCRQALVKAQGWT